VKKQGKGLAEKPFISVENILKQRQVKVKNPDSGGGF
jgi:hypothetical protein